MPKCLFVTRSDKTITISIEIETWLCATVSKHKEGLRMNNFWWQLSVTPAIGNDTSADGTSDKTPYHRWSCLRFSGAHVWNELPSSVIFAPSLAVFKRNLKTHLFGQSYSSHWCCVFYCFYFVCAVPLKLSGLCHVNLDVYNNNNNYTPHLLLLESPVELTDEQSALVSSHVWV